MKARSKGPEKEVSPESKLVTPQAVAGKPAPYNVDEFGFVHPNDSGIPLFSNEEAEHEPKIGGVTYLNEDKEKKPKKSQVSYT